MTKGREKLHCREYSLRAGKLIIDKIKTYCGMELVLDEVRLLRGRN